MIIKPTILTDEDVKDIRIEKDKFDWANLGIFLLGVVLSGVIGSGFGLFMLLIQNFAEP